MSEREIRQVLREVIQDLDSGRVRVERRPPKGWRRTVGTAVLATALGVGGGSLSSGCNARSIGRAVDAGPDATARMDAGPAPAYGEPFYDAAPYPMYGPAFDDGGIQPAYGEPFLDGGPVGAYGEPFLDASTQPAYAEPFYDAGANEDYGVPPVWGDAGIQPAYGVPFCPPQPE